MDFATMKRKNLQALCKKHAIPANLSNRQMATRLALLFQDDDKSLVSDAEADSLAVANNVKKVKFSPENETFIFDDSDSDSERTKRLKNRNCTSKTVMEKKTSEEVGEITEKVRTTRSRAKRVSEESELVLFPRKGRKIASEKKTVEEAATITAKVPARRSRARMLPVPEEEAGSVSLPVSVRGKKRLQEIVEVVEQQKESRALKLVNEAVGNGDLVVSNSTVQGGLNKTRDGDAGEIFPDTAAENIHKNPKRKSTKDKGLVVGRVTRTRTRGSTVEIEHEKSLEDLAKKTTAVVKKSKNPTKRQKLQEVSDIKPSGDATKGPRMTRSVTSLRSPDAFTVTADEETSETLNQDRDFNGEELPVQYDPVASIAGGETKEQRQCSANECSEYGTSMRDDVELTRGETNVRTEESSPVSDGKFSALDKEERSSELKKESAATGLLHTTLIDVVGCVAADTALEGEVSTKCEDLPVVEPTRDSNVGRKENSTIEDLVNCNALNENVEVVMEDSSCKMHPDAVNISENPTPVSLSAKGDHSNLFHAEQTLETEESVIGNNRCPESREASDRSSEDGRANYADEKIDSDETVVQELTTFFGVECMQAHEVDQTEDIIVTIEHKSEEVPLDNGSPSADAAAGSGNGYASNVEDELRQDPALNKQGSTNVLQESSNNDCSKLGTPKRNNIEEAPICDVGFPASDNKKMSCEYKKECRRKSGVISLLQSSVIRSAVKSEVSTKDEEIFQAEPMQELNVELIVKEKENCTIVEVRNCTNLNESAEKVTVDSSCELVNGEELSDYQLVQQSQDPENIYENPTPRRFSLKGERFGLLSVEERLETEESAVHNKTCLGSYKVFDEASEDDRSNNADAKLDSDAIDAHAGTTFNRESDASEELIQKHNVEKTEDISATSEQKSDEAPKHVSPSGDATVVDVLGNVDEDAMVSTQHESGATCMKRIDSEPKSLLLHISSSSGYEQECNLSTPDFSEELSVEHEEELEEEVSMKDDMLVQLVQDPKMRYDPENIYENPTSRRLSPKGERFGLLNVEERLETEESAVHSKTRLGSYEVSDEACEDDRANNADVSETKSLLLHVSSPPDEVKQECHISVPDFPEEFVVHEEEAQVEASMNDDSLTPNQSLCQHLQPVGVVAHLSFHSETIQNIDCFVSSSPADRDSDLHAHSEEVTAMELNESLNVKYAREEFVEANIEGEKFVEVNAVTTEESDQASESQSGQDHQVNEPVFYNVFSHCGEEDEESLKTSSERTETEFEVTEFSKPLDPGSTTCTDILSDPKNAETRNITREIGTRSNEVILEELERNVEDSTVLDGSALMAVDNYAFSDWEAENCNGNAGSVGGDSRSEAFEFPVILHDDDEVSEEIIVRRIGTGDYATEFLGEPQISLPETCTNRHATSDGSSVEKEVSNEEDTQFDQSPEFEEFTEAANIEETVSGTSAKCASYNENEAKLAENSGLEDDGSFGLENAGESATESGTDPSKQTKADVELAAMDKNDSNTELENVDSGLDMPVVGDGRTSENRDALTTNEEANFEACVAEDPESRHTNSMEANLLLSTDGSTRKKARDGKENSQKEQFSSITASRQSVKRRPLGDLQTN